MTTIGDSKTADQIIESLTAKEVTALGNTLGAAINELGYITIKKRLFYFMEFVIVFLMLVMIANSVLLFLYTNRGK